MLFVDTPDAPATKRDLAELKHELDDRFEATENRLLEAIRDAQTEILKAFFPFQESVTIRFRSNATTQEALDARMDVLERRLAEIEKRLLMPPAA